MKINLFIIYSLIFLSACGKDAEYYYNEGETLALDGEYELAIQSFNEAISHDSTFVNAYCQKSLTISKIGNYDVKDLKVLSRLDSKKAEQCYFEQAKSYVDEWISDQDNIENAMYAIQSLNEVIRLNQYSANAFNKRADVKVYIGDYTGAIEDFNQAIKLDPQNADYYFNRADFYYGHHSADKIKFNLTNISNANKDFNRAVKLSPNNANRYYYLRGSGRMIWLDNYRGAIEDFNQAIQLNPKDLDYYSSRAEAKVKLGDYKGAIEDFNQAIQLNPKDLDYYSSRAEAKVKLGDYKGAIEDFNQAIQLNPKDYESYKKRANARRDSGDYIGAVFDYDNAINSKNIGDDKIWIYFSRGLVKIKLGDYKGAIEDFYQKGEQKDEKQTIDDVKYALLGMNLGNNGRIIEEMDKIIMFNPNSLFAYKGRAYAKSELGDYRGAILDYDKIIHLGDEFSILYRERGLLKLKAQQKNLGCLDLSKAGELGDGKAYDLIRQYCN